MHDERGGERTNSFGPAALWLLVATATRFLYLGHWSLWGDEAFSLDDAQRMGTAAARAGTKLYPVFYVLERWALDALPGTLPIEWTLRFVPALAGALAVPAAFLLGSCLSRTRLTGHVLAGFATFSPWLLFHSQFARSYSLLVLLSTFGTLQYLRGLRSPRVVHTLLAAAAFTLAAFTHPCVLLSIAGLGAGGSVIAAQRAAPWPRVLAAPAFAVVAWTCYSLLHRETTDLSMGTQLADAGAGPAAAVDFLFGAIYEFGLLWTALALLGLAHLWRSDRQSAWIVLGGGVLPAAILLALGLLGRPVAHRYLLPAVPLLALLTARVVGEGAVVLAERWRRAPTLVPVLALIPFLPGVVSHYVDGDRHDLRAALAFVRDHWQPEDQLICESHSLVAVYWPDLDPSHVSEAPPEAEDVFPGRPAQGSTRTWVVVPSTFEQLGGLRSRFLEQVRSAGRCVREFHRRRFDYHQNRLLVFRIDGGEGSRRP